MLLTILYPFSDLRLFSETFPQEAILSKWPIPEHGLDFMRGFGMIQTRPLGGIANWIAEDVFCRSDNALRLPDFPRAYRQSESEFIRNPKISPLFRRFYSDGLAVAKYEIGISVKIPLDSFKNLTAFKRFLSTILMAKAVVYHGYPKRFETTLLRAGEALANGIFFSTTASAFFPELSSPSKWIQTGNPLVTVSGSGSEMDFVGRCANARHLSKQLGCDLFFFNLQQTGKNIPVWIFRSDSRAKSGPPRKLRVCMSRLHTERESLRLVLRSIHRRLLAPPPRSLHSDALQKYLNLTTRRISELDKQVCEYDDENILELAKKCSRLTTPGSAEALIRAIQNLEIRNNIFRKVEQRINQESTPMKTVNYNITGSVQTIIGDNADFSKATFIQWIQHQPVNYLPQLSKELKTLQEAMEQAATNPVQHAATHAITQAQVAASTGQSEKTAQYLKQAGEWALTIANGLMISLAIEAIKRSLGISC